jgi:hypothetical protein
LWVCSVAAISASHARAVNDAEGERSLARGFAAGLREADVCSARFSSRLSVSDRLVHGETRKFRNRPWKPLRPIIVASTTYQAKLVFDDGNNQAAVMFLSPETAAER